MDESSVRIEFSDPDAGRETGDDASTVDMLLRKLAKRTPSRLAYADPPNRDAVGLGPPRRVSFAEADETADIIAAHLSHAGLRPGDRIALRLPNIVELPLAIAGAWRAGLVPVCLPLLWRLEELRHAFSRIDPVAIITVGRFGGHNHSDVMREAAAGHAAIRHIFGIGVDLADGVVPIDGWFSSDDEGAILDTGDQRSGAPHALASVTWATGKDGAFPMPRTHRELLALGRMAAAQLGLGGDDTILSTYPMTSISSLAGQMVAALQAGAALLLHQPFSYDTFLAQLRDFGVTFTAVPNSVLVALHERGDIEEGPTSLRRIARVRPWPHQPSPPLNEAIGSLPVFDIHNIGELALIIERAPAPPGLPLGKIGLSGDGYDASAPYLETRVRGSVSESSRRTLSGTLLLRGLTVPSGPLECAAALADDTLRADKSGFLNSGLQGTVDADSADRFVCARQMSMIYHGGVAIAVEELDAAYASFPGAVDAAALPMEDDLMGERIFAAMVPSPRGAPSLTKLRQFLSARGVADYKCPEQIVIVRSIPRDEEGKVLRADLLNHL